LFTFYKKKPLQRQMYAVVKYKNYRKEQTFEVILTLTDIDVAKKTAFHLMKKEIPKDDNDIPLQHFKITNVIPVYYLRPINKCIIEYMLIKLLENNNEEGEGGVIVSRH
jgi:hypothetical protein